MQNLFVDETGRKWDVSDISLPLESDELVLQYLSMHNYDVNLAKFNLLCKIGVGKGKWKNLIIIIAFFY